MDIPPTTPTPDPVSTPGGPSTPASQRLLTLLRNFSNRLFQALSNINHTLNESLKKYRPMVITYVTARPYTVLLAVALVSIVSTAVIVRTTVSVHTTSGPNYSAMQHIISDLQHSKQTNWSIHTEVGSISGRWAKLTYVGPDHLCFEALSPDTTDHAGCLFYGHVAWVVTEDNGTD